MRSDSPVHYEEDHQTTNRLCSPATDIPENARRRTVHDANGSGPAFGREQRVGSEGDEVDSFNQPGRNMRRQGRVARASDSATDYLDSYSWVCHRKCTENLQSITSSPRRPCGSPHLLLRLESRLGFHFMSSRNENMVCNSVPGIVNADKQDQEPGDGHPVERLDSTAR
jgi:hypothetical protein